MPWAEGGSAGSASCKPCAMTREKSGVRRSVAALVGAMGSLMTVKFEFSEFWL